MLPYQQQVCLRDGRVMMLEALVRWNHPQRGLLTPLEFLPVARRLGVDQDIDRWAFRHALLAHRAWQAHEPTSPLSVAVNLSCSTLTASGSIKALVDTIDEAGSDPSLIEIEIDIEVLLNGCTTVRQSIATLARAGCRIAADNVRGLRTIEDLVGAPGVNVDIVKIDARARRDQGTTLPRAGRIAREAGITSVVTGIESTMEIERARAARMDREQGYVVCQPLSGGSVIRALRPGS